MKIKFIWDDWNVEHIGKHGVSCAEAEHVVRNARHPFPRGAGAGKLGVRGTTARGRWLQVIYVVRGYDSADYEEMPYEELVDLLHEDEPLAYVVHARDLRNRERP